MGPGSSRGHPQLDPYDYTSNVEGGHRAVIRDLLSRDRPEQLTTPGLCPELFIEINTLFAPYKSDTHSASVGRHLWSKSRTQLQRRGTEYNRRTPDRTPGVSTGHPLPPTRVTGRSGVGTVYRPKTRKTGRKGLMVYDYGSRRGHV